MMTEIGIVAGEIIDLLEKTNRPLTITEVKIFIDRPIDMIYMALGWLIRGNYVHVVTREEKYLFLVSKPVSLGAEPQGVCEPVS